MASKTGHVYTPSELNREIKLHLEAGFPRIVLEAEISNLARPASGHLYFSLKDDRAQVRCAMFRSAAGRLSMRPENGMKVLARGRVSLYEPRGEYQFIVDGLQDAGEGILQRQFEELKKKLSDEGLFDEAHKQSLPAFPARIALLTSASGAAVRDLLQVLDRRWPLASVRLYPVRVQGAGAPMEIRRAIEAANRHGWAELLIMGRGGGSLEDLLAFNDEAVARTVFASAIPVISAVGHETDFSICDFVADLRAPTPSAAAELATPDQRVLKNTWARGGRQLERRMQERLLKDNQSLDHLGHRLMQQHPASQLAQRAERLQRTQQALHREVSALLGERGLRLESLAKRLAAHRPDRKLSDFQDRLNGVKKALQRLGVKTVHDRSEQLAAIARTLNAVSPLETLGRGYAIVSSTDSGDVISSVSQVKTGDRVQARVSDGSLDCTVDAID